MSSTENGGHLDDPLSNLQIKKSIPRASDSAADSGQNYNSGTKRSETDVDGWVALLSALPRDRARAITSARKALEAGSLTPTDRQLADLIIRER